MIGLLILYLNWFYYAYMYDEDFLDNIREM